MFELTSGISNFFLLLIFLTSLFFLVKGADFLLEGAERIGKFFLLSPFIIGALIVGIGTSLPELLSSIFAILSGANEIVAANVIGSNIANMLLVAGLSSVVGGFIYTTKNLIRLEIPLLVISTSIFIFVAFDGVIDFWESLIVFLSFLIYFAYLLNPKKFLTELDKKEMLKETEELVPEDVVKKIGAKEFTMLFSGLLLLSIGANYLVDSVVMFSEKNDIAMSVVSVLAIAIGTSLPEIIVSVKAVLKGKIDLAFGNVFGSNVFNLLMLVGVLGLFTDLKVAENMVTIGLPFLAISTLIFYVSSSSNRIYVWEGLTFLLIYVLFVLKIIGV